MTDAIEKLSDYIRDEVGYNGELSPDIDLLEEQILDSFSVVEIATFIQSSFDVQLQGEDLVRENFASLENMAALIDKRLAAN